MKAIVHQYKTGFDGVEYKISPERALNDGEVKVKLKSAGLNHRDLFIMNNRKEMQLPLILGSDGAGIVSKLETVFLITYYIQKLLLILVLDGNMLLKYRSYRKC